MQFVNQQKKKNTSSLAGNIILSNNAQNSMVEVAAHKL